MTYFMTADVSFQILPWYFETFDPLQLKGMLVHSKSSQESFQSLVFVQKHKKDIPKTCPRCCSSKIPKNHPKAFPKSTSQVPSPAPKVLSFPTWPFRRTQGRAPRRIASADRMIPARPVRSSRNWVKDGAISRESMRESKEDILRICGEKNLWGSRSSWWGVNTD